ncbi:deoxynucleoside kinase [Lentilactobacillus senioris]|uniref:deoxynucleoside kinase n=1 Tax=Lentilactobacillus senioris TaxID=931534 RepID=UPI00228235A8|nr:deoxynucleoside kinase [Lentilactobacillus senioris]MCY9807472.1 deoxynucleoside kinase [Lentilactobacillus senioris]
MIVLSGTIGAGKTSLTSILSEHLGTKAFYEPVGDNPVLPLFYSNPQQYGFLLQMYFLDKRFKSMKQAQSDDNNILDRSIYEDALFTDLNHELGRITDEETDVYHHILDNMMEELPFAAKKKRPDLLVHISVSLDTQLKRIRQRGRDYEQIENDDSLLDYYKLLHDKYEKWYEDYNASPKMIIDGDIFDFMNSREDAYRVVQMIDDALILMGNLPEDFEGKPLDQILEV